jgi:lysozyme
MIASNSIVSFIKQWEEFRAIAYQDQAGVWTIGYGTTIYKNGTPVKEGDGITEENACLELLHECDGIARKITAFVNRDLHQHEFDALVSFAYNIGTQGFKHSTLLRELNYGRPIHEDYFIMWHKVTIDGKLRPSKGLMRRRLAESRLFKTGEYD